MQKSLNDLNESASIPIRHKGAKHLEETIK